MRNQKKGNKLTRFLKLIYWKLFRIHDTPKKIAEGFGLGVFLGILPGAGPLAAVFCALLFKVNRASALLGSLLTNTWLSLVTFVLSIKIGSAILNMNLQAVKDEWSSIIHNFHWDDLIKVSFLKIVAPVALGYCVIGVCAGVTAYGLALLLMKWRRHENKN